MCVVVRFVCLFVGSCATLLFYVVNTLSWGWKWCQQFFGSHQFSVTLSTKDFPHHSALVFYFIFIFYVPVGLGTIVPNVSVCDIELKHSSYVHASQVCWWEAEVNLVWEKHSGAIVLEKKSIFFPPLLLTAVAVHCWRATSAYTWSDVDDVLLTTPSFFMFT